MPNLFLEADNRFPALDPGQSTEARFQEIRDYLFILLEQLRYLLSNLDASNFNETGLKELSDLIGADVTVENISTTAIYAAYGDVAHLAVDELTTSRRIVKYLAGDTTDDNYLHIKGEKIRYISGVYANGTEQAVNPDGALLYWKEDPDGAGVYIGSNGYPFKADGSQIMTTTDPTAWPVYVYTYSELVKAKFEFTSDGQYYLPKLTFGAGDGAGNNIGWLFKTATEFQLLFRAFGGKQLGLVATYAENNAAGYLDLYGTRQTANLDFSHWDDGYFTETPDGTATANRYVVVFDAESRPVSITDAAGHVCTVTWPTAQSG